MRYLLYIIFLILSGCKNIVYTGSYISDHQVDKLKDQKLSQEEVVSIIGSPNITPIYSPNNWYYVSRSFNKGRLTKPKLYFQRIIKLKFNKDNILEDIEVEDSTSDKEVHLVKDSALGSHNTSLGHFWKNLGRFTKNKEKHHR